MSSWNIVLINETFQVTSKGSSIYDVHKKTGFLTPPPSTSVHFDLTPPPPVWTSTKKNSFFSTMSTTQQLRCQIILVIYLNLEWYSKFS